MSTTGTTNDNVPHLVDVPRYADFLEKYLKPNRPVLIGPALVQHWPAFQLWTRATEDGKRTINWHYLAEHYGLQEVSVADCSTSDSFGNLQCTSTLFGSVVNQWQHGNGQALYVKDWHLPRAVESAWAAPPCVPTPPPTPPEIVLTDELEDIKAEETKVEAAAKPHAFYTTPRLFRDDWMNAYYTAYTPDDFRFVYCGAQGTFTPLHRDVYCSYSWSTNVCGRKRWWLFPPEDKQYLFMKERRVSVHDVRCVDEERFPEFKKARPLVVIQEEGETIFIPSGWYHQVENLTACISINHNWCNSVNLPSLYKSMCEEIVEVEKALYDVRDMLMESHKGNEPKWRQEFTKIVQDVVQKDAGWNWLTFWKMVYYALGAAVVSSHPDVEELSELLPLPHAHHAVAQPVFPPAGAELHPPLAFIVRNVKACCEDFVTRDRYEGEGDVGEIVNKIRRIISVVESHSKCKEEDVNVTL